MSEVKARIVRSDGQEMTLGNNDWRIPNDGLENWANLPYSVSSVEIPSYDGALITDKRVSSVDRTITAQSRNVGENPNLRAQAIWFFNPKYSFEVYLTYMGRTRWCSGEQIGFKASEGNVYKPIEITWTILCPNPYLQSVEDFGKDIAEIKGKFGFPFRSLHPSMRGVYKGINTGFIASQHLFQKSVVIRNDGDVPSGMRVIIRAKGDVTNPMVRVGDGWIKLIATMQANDKVELDASSRPPTIKFNGENAMHLLDRKSSILDMMISVGETTIEYDADDGEQFMSVAVFYNKQYLGV